MVTNAADWPWYAGFDWEVAWFSGWQWPVFGVASYLVLVAFQLTVMRSLPALELPRVTAAHNLVLSFGSLAMFLGTALELRRRWQASGSVEWFFCESPAVRAEGPLYFWSYVYYLSKFYELFDTVLVLLQKSRVPHFKLQVYHHAAVIPMAWLWCQQRQSLQWGGLLFNTLVHVVMYQYYAWKVLGLPTPWKRWITKLQIVQFVTSFFLLSATLVYLFQKQGNDTCAGMSALFYNCVFNATLLLQFINVDKRNSQAGGGKGKKSSQD